MELRKAIANYNMTFNYGSFKKGQTYLYRKNPEDNMFYVTTEEKTEQDFFCPEFNTFFTLLKN